MKVIRVDKFHRPTVPDTLVCENCTELDGRVIVLAFGTGGTGENGSYEYKVVGDDYPVPEKE